MNKNKILSGFKISFLIASGLVIAQTATANPSLWKDSNTKQFKTTTPNDSVFKHVKSRKIELDVDAFKHQYINTPARKSALAQAITLTIPLPQGGSISVDATESAMMAPELAALLPETKVWKVQNLAKNISGRVDFTPNGFHAMLNMGNGDTVFVEPETNNSNHYISFSKRDNIDSFNSDFQCQTHSGAHSASGLPTLSKQAAAKPASKLITYRLAVAATGEYTSFFGSKNSALSSIISTINRVNEVYERDLGITFKLIADEADLIYRNANTDPYTNSDADALLEENIFVLSASGILNESQYDIGHVFTTGSGGLALIRSVCDFDLKAGGTTGIPNPRGIVFAIDFVAHELGHQLGANHTFNSETGSCGGNNRNGATAVEPGGGSTVMAYAGICGDNNIQEHSDPFFHAVSIAEIFINTRSSGADGSVCGNRAPQSNNDPVPSAGVDAVIPANTPFILSGTATDSDNDSLTYSWEQVDAGSASDINVDTGDNAIIRSFAPVTTSTRYIPNLVDLFQGRRLKSEKLPERSRDLKFSMTARDNKGGFDFDEMVIEVANTGNAFSVTSHASAGTLEVGRNTQVNWDVAGTNASPINCRNVDIDLLQSNGNRIALSHQTSNDGVETVAIPSAARGIKNARIMVMCSASKTTFFNISAADLSVVSDNDDNDSDGDSSSGGGSFDYILLLLLLLGVYQLKSTPRAIKVPTKKTGLKK